MDDSGTVSSASSSLQCREGLTSSFSSFDSSDSSEEEGDEAVSINIYNYAFSETEDEYIETLVKKELSSGIKKDDGSSSDAISMKKMNDSLKRARLVAVNSIMERKDSGRFRSQTAYLAVIYLDRFMSNQQIENWKPCFIELTAIACFRIAAKIEEGWLPAPAHYLSPNYSFDRKLVEGMESGVLIRLEWRMISITPFAYLHYFIAKLSDESRPQDLASRAVELILSMTKENNLLDHRSYAIAAAAILVTLDRNLTRDKVEDKMSLVSSSVHVELEHVFSCYSIMQELDVEKLKASSIHTSVTDLLDDSPIIPGSTKRKRLTYSDPPQQRG